MTTIRQLYINIKAVRGSITQDIEFPEDYTDWNRFRWWLVGIIAPVQVRWFE